MYGEKFMVSLVRRIGHIVKHGPEIIKNNIVINRLKRHNHFNKVCINRSRNPKIIVSLTSYRKRFPTLDICIKSILNQTLLPDHLILYLSKDEKAAGIPKQIENLKKYGLEIKFVDLDLKPHKKYYYAMKEFPDDIVITMDDDIVYASNVIDELYKTYKRFPKCVIAARAHEITFNKKGVNNYDDWNQCCTNSYEPSFLYMATEGAGALYPPHLLNPDILFDLTYIKKYINVDDLWMKAVEILSDVPVVICDHSLEDKRIEIPSAQKTALAIQNVGQKQNDVKLKELDIDFNIFVKLEQAEKRLNSKD